MQIFASKQFHFAKICTPAGWGLACRVRQVKPGRSSIFGMKIANLLYCRKVNILCLEGNDDVRLPF